MWLIQDSSYLIILKVSRVGLSCIVSDLLHQELRLLLLLFDSMAFFFFFFHCTSWFSVATGTPAIMSTFQSARKGEEWDSVEEPLKAHFGICMYCFYIHFIDKSLNCEATHNKLQERLWNVIIPASGSHLRYLQNMRISGRKACRDSIR